MARGICRRSSETGRARGYSGSERSARRGKNNTSAGSGFDCCDNYHDHRSSHPEQRRSFHR